MIHDERPSDAPPCDALAERIVLHRCLMYPTYIDSVDMEPLFVFPDHKRLWRVMVLVRKLVPEANGFEFTERFMHELEASEPAGQFIDDNYALYPYESDRAFEEAEVTPHHDPGRLLMSEYFHTTQWWLDRLRTIQTARKRIEILEQLAARSWESLDRPLLDAEFMRRLAPVLVAHPDTNHRDIGMDIPV